MAELYPGDYSGSPPPAPRFRLIAELAAEVSREHYEQKPLDVKYILFLDEREGLQLIGAEQQLAEEPEAAHDFVFEQTNVLPDEYHRSWQFMLIGQDSTGGLIDVDGEIGHIIGGIGTYADKKEHFGSDGVSDRAQYLERQLQRAAHPEHYYRFPEILCALRLYYQLDERGYTDRADGVAVLVAAYETVYEALPLSDKMLPKTIFQFIQEEKRAGRGRITGGSERR